MGVKIAIIDYEMGNLKSIYKCLKHINAEPIITDKTKEIEHSDGVILPGVGAFGDAMKHLKAKNLIEIINQIVNDGKPLFGICLGLQLLYSKSDEMGLYEGLNLIEGDVILFEKEKVGKIPQIGWNSVNFLKSDHFLVQGIPNNSYFYFVHSYYGKPKNNKYILGSTRYGEIEYGSMLAAKNIIATQFHPEKSSKYGIMMYQNFIEFCKK